MVLLVVVLGASVVVFLAARRAPEGYEDEGGFHLGVRREQALASDGADDASLAGIDAPDSSAGAVAANRWVCKRSDRAAFHRV